MHAQFYNFSRVDLSGLFQSKGLSPAHATTLYRHVYRDVALSRWPSENFPSKIEAILSASFTDASLSIKSTHISGYDNSVKFVVVCEDHKEVEMVLIPEKQRMTLCVSSQVGCAQACSFCMTGRMGLKRHLRVGEIVEQVLLANRWMVQNPTWLAACVGQPPARVTNVVFMGMGEPLDNAINVAKAIDILTDPVGCNIGPRKISVSTSGHLEGLREFRKLQPQIPIALSLHSPFDGERSRLMPINRRWSIAELLKEVAEINAQAKKSVMIQYTLINSVNDTERHARALTELLTGYDVKINLIPFNEIGPAVFKSPTSENVQVFRDILHEAGIRTMVRYSKGQDTGGACGQLVS